MKTLSFNLGALFMLFGSYWLTWQHQAWWALACFLAALPVYRIASKTEGQS